MNDEQAKAKRLERIKRRADGREQARDVLHLIDTSVTHPDVIDGFLDELTSALKPKEAAESEKLRQKQFAEYASFRLNFGQYAAEPLENIPREYLEWLHDSTVETLEALSGYLEATEPETSE